MDLGLMGKVALVTAASRGLGKAIALELAGEGAQVALCARGEADLAGAAEAVRERAQAARERAQATRERAQAARERAQATGERAQAGGAARVLARPLDVTDGPAIEGFVAEVERELGPIDCCLVNAGGPPALGFFETDLAAWEAAYRLNLESSVRLCRLVMPGMIARGWGRIVQVTSVTVRQPVQNLVLSNVIRPAVHALTRCLALEGAPRGVTVNSVAPGFHATSASERLIRRQLERGEAPSREAALAQQTRDIPAGRLGQPEEFAALVAFLMSARAGYVTGQLIVADGGWVRATF